MIGRELFEGERVRLTALSGDDAATIAGWYENAAFMRLFDATTAYPLNAEQMMERITEWQKSDAYFVFAVRRLEDQTIIGIVGLTEISWRNRLASLEIALDPNHWGQGYGGEALRLVLRYGFAELNLHRVQLTVFAYNEAARRLYEKTGFRHEGAFREAVYRDGQYHGDGPVASCSWACWPANGRNAPKRSLGVAQYHMCSRYTSTA
jgi:RimJ/RimL family protein N-acetyltransferase